MRDQWPLVGRAAEFQRLQALLADSSARGVVLGGPPGVGKTRLASEVAEQSGREVLRVSATRAAATIPLGAFAPFLPASGLGDLPDQGALRLAADALVRTGGNTDADPLLFVDDAHALDDASAALLLHLAITGGAFLLVTLRTGSAGVPDALHRLWKDVLPRIDLEPLTIDDVGEVLEAALGGLVDAASAYAIHDACRGNALYLRELLDGLLESGRLDERSGAWTLRGPITAPPRLIELVTARLDGLTGRERFVLETLALTEPMGLPIIEGLGWAEEWGSLERKHLAEVRRSDRRQQLFVAHPMHAEVLRATITIRRRNAILSESARSVAMFKFRRREDARRVAVWHLDAGNHADPQVLLAAARDAFIASDKPAAERFARAALDDGAGAEAALILGLSASDLGNYDDAEAVLHAASQVAELPNEASLLAIARASNLFRGMARADEAREVLEEAEARVPDELTQHQLAGQRAIFSLFEGDVATTLELTDPLLTVADEESFCAGALPAAMIRLLCGRIDEALDIATKAYEVRSRTDTVQLGSAEVYLTARAMAITESGDIAEAIALAQQAYDIAAAEQDRNEMAWLAVALGRAHLLSGRLASTARLGSEAALLFGELNHPGARWGYGLAALAAAQRGDVDAAEEAIADLDAEPDTVVRMMDSELERARAWTLAARGDLPRARAALLNEADRMAERGLFLLEVALLYDVARLGDPGVVAERLASRAANVDGGLMQTRIEYVQAMAESDGPRLDAAGDAFEALGAVLFAAEAANEAAIAFRRDGATRPAAAAAQRSALLADRCDGARTYSLMHGTGSAVLTKREREVATLASHGMSNREIASTLYVSVRTVENHVQHAMEKLGVSSRNELADALARAGY
jgi:DNA-binding CsgD family transcriptional regulator/tetratricopeptide (TPR) repeat protein